MSWKYTGINKKGFKSFYYDVFPTMRPGYWYGDYDEDKYKQYRFFHDGIGNVLTFGLSGKHIDSSISYGENQAYMKRYGIDYDDITNPGNLPGHSEGSFSGAALNFVSDNVRKLYK